MRSRNTANRKALTTAETEQGKRMEVALMSNELSIYEAMGGTYTEVDGLFYPDITVSEESDISRGMVGKYGLLWIDYMKSNHAERYRHHIRMGTLISRALEVNDEAYEMLDTIMNRYLQKHKPVNPNSTMEIWKLREQAKQIAEEEVYETIVYRFY